MTNPGHSLVKVDLLVSLQLPDWSTGCGSGAHWLQELVQVGPDVTGGVSQRWNTDVLMVLDRGPLLNGGLKVS